MNDLTTWLRAQLDDDERAAREAQLGDRGEWERGDRSPTGGTDVWDLNSRSDKPDRGFFRIADGLDPEVVDHIARYDPARVLAEVDAKRQRLTVIEIDLADDPTDETALHLLRLELLPYADRAGYREEWRP